MNIVITINDSFVEVPASLVALTWARYCATSVDAILAAGVRAGAATHEHNPVLALHLLGTEICRAETTAQRGARAAEVLGRGWTTVAPIVCNINVANGQVMIAIAPEVERLLASARTALGSVRRRVAATEQLGTLGQRHLRADLERLRRRAEELEELEASMDALCAEVLGAAREARHAG